MRVEVFLRPHCSLCERALDWLHDAQEEQPFDLEQHNVLEHEEWFAVYRYEVPVIAIDGIKRLALDFTREALLAVVREARSPQVSGPECSGHGGKEVGVFPHADDGAIDQGTKPFGH